MGDHTTKGLVPPKYEWKAKDQLREMRLFQRQLEHWFTIQKTKDDQKLIYTLSFLGKEGYAAQDRWVPKDDEDATSYKDFLGYISGTLDNEISARVRVYELEDIKKRAGETIDELVDRIRQLARLAKIGDNTDASIEFEVQRRLIRAIPDSDIQLRKELLKIDSSKGVSELLTLCRTYYAVETGAKEMCSGASRNVDAVRTHKQKGQHYCYMILT